jgi:secondary thiamine-phosphate synthase enzyme
MALHMSVLTKYFTVKTKGDTDILDITGQVGKALKEAQLKNGILTVFVPGSTAGITTTEYEPGLLADLPATFEKLAPKAGEYKHNLTWGDGNGYAHVRAALLKSFFTVPFVDGEMILGTWQQIILVDFDNRRRQREIVVQIIGE